MYCITACPDNLLNVARCFQNSFQRASGTKARVTSTPLFVCFCMLSLGDLFLLTDVATVKPETLWFMVEIVGFGLRLPFAIKT